MSDILENELVKKYFGCKQPCPDGYHPGTCLSIESERVLRAMQEEIKLGERYIYSDDGGKRWQEVISQHVQFVSEFHPFILLLPSRFLRRNKIMPTGIYKRSKTEQDRFWEKVNKTANCWIWTGSCGTNWGYGEFWANNKKMLAHRYSWILHNGKIPKTFKVLHKCDNPPCVRPDHLWVGDDSDNMRDMVSKGRHWIQQRPYDLPPRNNGDFGKLVALARGGK